MKKTRKKNIKKKSINSKIEWVFIIFYFGLMVYFGFHFFGAVTYSKDSSLGFVSEHSHTGLVAPASQIVFNDQQISENQYAINVADPILASKNVSVALFDIVSAPAYQMAKSRIVLMFFSIGAGVLFVMFIISVMRRFKESKIKT
jgi:capsule polysaccharide export protein KpsE/RkpR